MAELAKVLEFTPSQPPGHHKGRWSQSPNLPPVRLIPGRDEHEHFASSREHPRISKSLASSKNKLARSFLPEAFQLLHPSKLGTCICDLAILGTLLISASRINGIALPFIAVYLFLFFVMTLDEGLYRAGYQRTTDQIIALGKALLWTTLLTYSATAPLAGNSGLFRTCLLITSAGICSLTLVRLLWNELHMGSQMTGNALVIGDPAESQKVIDALRRDPHLGAYVKGFLPEQCLQDAYGVDVLRTVARQECIDELIVATRNLGLAQAIIEFAQRNHLTAKIFLDVPSAQAVNVEASSNFTLLRVYDQPLPQWHLAFKRLCDVTFALSGLILLSPMLFLISLAIKLDSRGPVLYRAVRIGHRGRRFICFKFRTMTENADAEKENLRARNEREGAFFKILDDPRITRRGRFLRRYSLDELPQLWNVVRGEMSLVGPRPHPPDDVEGYKDEQLQRLDFIPGMTGLWQVSARQDPSFERCVALDVEYIKHWSPALDFRILFKTVMAVLQGSGV
jgi:exopolysaccharide biosynthesis polyprenyl glycosylphosphotransferase